jgi:putative intracellular protease/amidase
MRMLAHDKSSDSKKIDSKKILVVASNPAVSDRTGWPIGFWWAELTHPYWEFTQRGYQVDIASPEGGALEADSWSDPRDASGYAAEDLLSLGFLSSPRHAALVANSLPLSGLDANGYDAVFLVGGQAPMYTFYNDERVHRLVADRVEAGRLTAVVCHATSVLLKARTSDGQLVAAGRTWTGFANSEEEFVESYVGKPIQPFRIEDEARMLTGTNFIVHGPFAPHAVRDGQLITGQQQHSGAVAARLVIDALGA